MGKARKTGGWASCLRESPTPAGPWSEKPGPLPKAGRQKTKKMARSLDAVIGLMILLGDKSLDRKTSRALFSAPAEGI